MVDVKKISSNISYADVVEMIILKYVKFEVHMATSMKMTVSCDVSTCGVIDIDRFFKLATSIIRAITLWFSSSEYSLLQY